MENEKPGEPQKLNKKYFLGLPAGVYLVSNCYEMVTMETYTPAFYEYVVAPDQRESQWQRIKAAGANQRQCEVYENADEFKESLRQRTGRSASYPRLILVEKDDSGSSKT